MSHDDHAAKAASLLRTLNAIGRGEGPIGTTPTSRDLMSREALTESVLALNETLNRIFPADQDPAAPTGDVRSDFTVHDNDAAQATALDMISRSEAYRLDPDDHPSEDMTRAAMSAAEAYRAKGARAVIVDGPKNSRWVIRLNADRTMRVLAVRRTEPVKPPVERTHLGVIDLALDGQAASLRPETIPADDWKQIVSAAVTARAIGSVGAKSTLSTPDGDGVTYEIEFRTTVSDDQWKIKRTTPVGDIYRLEPEATA
jgi:hypothetical protein